MKTLDELKEKIKVKGKEYFDKAVPVVKAEVKNSVNKSAIEVKDMLFKVATVGALAYLVLKPRNISLPSYTKTEDLARNFNLYYNEVHNTYNYYCKEDVKNDGN